VDAVADEDTTGWVLVGVGPKLPRMGCAIVYGSRGEKQAAGPMRDQHCWSGRGAHGVEKQSGGMQQHMVVQGATSDGCEGDWDGGFTVGSGISGNEGDGVPKWPQPRPLRQRTDEPCHQANLRAAMLCRRGSPFSSVVVAVGELSARGEGQAVWKRRKKHGSVPDGDAGDAK
jgi:hypothetical protein